MKIKAIREILAETVPCKKCGCLVSELAIFPGHICLQCHEAEFNSEVRANGGKLPRPDFTKLVNL